MCQFSLYYSTKKILNKLNLHIYFFQLFFPPSLVFFSFLYHEIHIKLFKMMSSVKWKDKCMYYFTLIGRKMKCKQFYDPISIRLILGKYVKHNNTMRLRYLFKVKVTCVIFELSHSCC